MVIDQYPWNFACDSSGHGRFDSGQPFQRVNRLYQYILAAFLHVPKSAGHVPRQDPHNRINEARQLGQQPPAERVHSSSNDFLIHKE